MMLKKRLTLTKALVIFSILGSLGSYYTLAKGWGEIYPFYTYKLFSQPLGTNNTNTEYRIYSKLSPDDNFKRNKVLATKGFDLEDYVFTLNFLTKNVLSDTLNNPEHKAKLLLFIKQAVPGQYEYKVVSETYHPLYIIKNGSHDTTTVVTF